jgi:hypothetical protein
MTTGAIWGFPPIKIKHLIFDKVYLIIWEFPSNKINKDRGKIKWQPIKDIGHLKYLISIVVYGEG